jgi:N-acetylgalactosamine-6-sulfatase
MMAHMDATIGALLAKLDELGIRKNTLVLFSSDNGGVYEGDIGPLKGGKTDLHEGGIRVPMIASWPGVIPAGRTIDAMAGSVDLLPTFCAAAGVTVPAAAAIDGIDLLPLLTGARTAAVRGPMYWQLDLYPNLQRYYPKPKPYATEAVMDGPWKLLARDGAPLELFHLESDIGETTNLLEAHPDRVQSMTALIRGFLDAPRDRSGIRPMTAEQRKAATKGAPAKAATAPRGAAGKAVREKD